MENIRDFEYRAPRFETDFHFFLQTELDPRVLYARCYEISECGLVARLSEVLQVNTRATLILTLPGDLITMPIAATVTRRHGPDHAFAFIFSLARDREHLQQYLLSARSSGS